MIRFLTTLTAILFFAFVASAQQITVSGFVYESQSGEPLISASVRSGERGVLSNEQGFYSIRVPAGDVRLETSYLGCAPVHFSFRALRDTVVNISLIENLTLAASRAVAQSDSGMIHAVVVGAHELSVEQFSKTPMLLGEGDILKTLQLLPGVQSGVGGFTGLYVRGGASSDNLMLLDGVPFYNVDHMLGLFSVFMPEAVKKVTLYKGFFPAYYGGRSSSVVDVRTNDGNMYRHTGSFGVSLLSSHLHLEGPITSGKTSYSISGRLMHTAFATPIIRRFSEENVTNYWFYDINAKITHRIGSKDKIGLIVFNNRDFLHGEEDRSSDEILMIGYTIAEFHNTTDIAWDNRVACAHWNHVFGPRMFMDFSVSYNRYRLSTDILTEEVRKYPEEQPTEQENLTLRYGSGIRDWQTRADFDFFPSPAHRLRFGAAFLHHTYSPETYEARCVIQQDGETWMDMTRRDQGDVILFGLEGVAYGEDEFKVGQYLTFRPGLHTSFFNVRSRSYISLQPRLSVSLDLDRGLSVKGGYSRMVQHVHLLSSSQVTLPMDLWVPVTDKVKPEISDQVSGGLYYTGLPGWSFSLEAYYKDIQNVLEYKDGVSYLGNTGNWEDKVTMGVGRSRGIECLVNKTNGATTGWISYTLSKTERRFEEAGISRGEWFPYKYDRRHVLSLVVNHRFGPRVDIGATWSFASGGVITVPLQQTVALSPFNGFERLDLVDRRGNYRLPSAHRLNVGINFRKQLRTGERVWNISVYNAYNYMTPDLVDITADKKMKITTLLPIVPSIGYSIRF